MAEPLPFEQQPGESGLAFAAFIRYRDMGRQRSVDAAYAAHKKGPDQDPNRTSSPAHPAPTYWKAWSRKYHWQDRAQSYDALLDARARHAAELDIVEQRTATYKAHAEEGKATRQVGRGGLNMIVQLLRDAESFDEKLRAASLAVRYLEAGQRMERQAMGETIEGLAPPVPIGLMDEDMLLEFVAQLEARLSL